MLLVLRPRTHHLISAVSKTPLPAFFSRKYSCTTLDDNDDNGHNDKSTQQQQMTIENYDAMKYRKWVQVKGTCEDEKNKFSVMSFNLLSRHYIWPHVYKDLSSEYLDWNGHRFPLINKTIQQFQCDIICLQEMEYHLYKHFWSKQFPSSEYTSFYVQKSSIFQSNKDDKRDGVGIFVNATRFDVLKEKRINFGQLILKDKKKYQYTKDLMNRLLPRNTVALILKLYDKQADKIVYVTNTHLYWSPQYNDVKVLQTKLMLDQLKKFVKEVNASIIFLGDLNSNHKSDVFNLITKETLDTLLSQAFAGKNYGVNNALIDKQGKVENPIPLKSAYEKLLAANQLRFTSFAPSFADVLDHIFVSDDIEVHSILGGVDESYISSLPVKGFPNEQFPSDHIPIIAELSYERGASSF
ncbi:uncharacterized protein LODBEIA_P07070 [Lodderomyces beijingensis]|uniref:Endonuclease/exonuclease/phosphatase domain-containing protein n=1 Tax=Lodderomyces beijingensis TaxID=1775926 RepID=A0ABP0ZFZ9_9ASCO